MPTIAVCTLGCKVNQYDTQAMLELFQQAGYEAGAFDEFAEVYLINTCTVTGTGDQKSKQMIRRAHRRNPSASIIVAGCMAQRAAEALLLPGVRLIVGTQNRKAVVRLLERAMAQTEPLLAVEALKDASFEALSIHASEGRTRATLKIQEGCDQHCTYCIIPSVRGPVRSRPLCDVREEAERLAEHGFQEIVLTGIHLSSYGKDLDHTGLPDVLEALERTDGIARVRLGSLEPNLITPEFVQTLRGFEKLCPQFMLALQSGSDSVLRRMGRRYTAASYQSAVECLRGTFPDMALTTDLLCGFPGETEAEFQQTLDFVEACAFSRIHVFPYSPREGTPAARMDGQVDARTKSERTARLMTLGKRLAQAYVDRFLDSVQPVLFEQVGADGPEGYTPHYIRVCAPGTLGAIQQVRLVKRWTDGAKGVLISG